MKRSLKKTLLMSCVASVAFAVAVFMLPAAADETPYSKITVYKKAIGEGVNHCYSKGYMRSQFDVKDYTSFGAYLATGGTSETEIGLPLIYNDLDDSDVSCKQLFDGYHAGNSGSNNLFRGAFNVLGKTVVNSTDNGDKRAFLENMSYKVTNEEELNKKKGNRCIYLFYNVEHDFTYVVPFVGVYSYSGYPKHSKRSSKWLCTEIDEEGHIMSETMWTDSVGSSTDIIQFEIHKNKVNLDCATMSAYWRSSFGIMANGGLSLGIFSWFGNDGGCNKDHAYIVGQTLWEEFYKSLLSEIVQQASHFDYCEDLACFSTWWFDISNDSSVDRCQDGNDAYCGFYREVDEIEGMYKFALDGTSSEQARKATQYVTDYGTYDALKLTEEERFVLYQYYITDYFKIDDDSLPADTTMDTSAYTKVKLADVATGEMTTKYIKPKKHANDKVYGVKSDMHFWEKKSFSEVASVLANSTLTSIDPSLFTTLQPTNEEIIHEREEEEAAEAARAAMNCYDSAGAMGWILCPIIDKGQQTIEWLYGFIEGFLKINTNLFTTEGSMNGTYTAWATFQGIANGAFVIIFLVVIFSQLTGYGIDNYGIKKILPKLIIAAILINLSYIICQLAIDIANIVGTGIKGLFTAIQSNIVQGNVAAIKLDGDTTRHTVQAGLAGGIIITVVAAICVGAVLATNGAIIVPVLVTLLTILISVLFLFVILAVRQAMAVLLVVASPCAFLCYMLPNTKGIFNKWFKAIQGLLIAYPVCSAMIYGGEMVSTILLASNSNGGVGTSNFALALSAAAVSVAPIFMIPGIIKGSMGKISGAIAGAGRGLSRRGAHGIRNSNFAHDMKRREMLGRAGIKMDKNGQVKYTTRGKLQNLMTGSKAGKMRLDAVRADALGSLGTMKTAGKYSGKEGLANLNNAQEKRRVADLEDKIKNSNESNDIDGMGKKLQAAIESGDTDSIKAYTNVLTAKGSKGRAAVRGAITGAGKSAETMDSDAKAQYTKGVKAFSQNVIDNHKDTYENKDRSVYEFANNNLGGGEVNAMSDHIDTGKLTASQMAGMDDPSMERLANQPIDDNIRAAAYAALHNENGVSGMEQQRRTQLEKLAEGYTPAGEEPSTPASDWSKMTDAQKKTIVKSTPRKEGESTAEWAARIKEETGFSVGSQAQPEPSDWSKMSNAQKKTIVKAAPRKEGESTAEWGARIQRETGFTIGKQGGKK
ncbi:MAG: hypothetical protein MJ154_01180 [Candidatus Saccharibacteria bacterium]|nr:hypothetical protein [Candidatus Saccharibacteria bacterium]